MELFELMKHRRSIRKYQNKQIPKPDLEKIIEAGMYAPNAGGGQRSMIVGIHNQALAETVGRLNLARFDRSKQADKCKKPGAMMGLEQQENTQ